MSLSQLTDRTVLVVGGGLVGLSAAVFLAQQGVRTVLVEKHLGSSKHPRAIGYTSRSMEAFRATGLAEQIPQAPVGFRLRRAKVESLEGKWENESDWTQKKPAAGQQEPQEKGASKPGQGQPGQGQGRRLYSPYTGAAIAQDKLEPLLRKKAIELGVDARLGLELISLEQDGSSVSARVRERKEGAEEYTIKAEYAIAADGHKSGVREGLKIGRTGRGLMRVLRSVLFRAPLDKYLESGVHQFNIENPDGFQAFLTTYNDGRWVLMFGDDTERDEATLTALIKKCIGKEDVPVEIITTGRWELSALIADTFQSGRIFLAGDAAHTLPPNRGGYGANTGIDDAHNIAWKLASVLSGKSRPELLATYDSERRPIALLRHQQIFARPDYAEQAKGDHAKAAGDGQIFDDESMEFGQLYRAAVANVQDSIGEDAEKLPSAARPEQWSGQIGTRAQHLPLKSKPSFSKTVTSEKPSTLDLFLDEWVLLFEDDRWASLAESAAHKNKVPLRGVNVTKDVELEDLEEFRKAFGWTSTRAATLVRPDGYIAWRSKDLTNDLILSEILAKVSFSTAN